jgi:mono/diheme cytochrome c family protein
MRKFLFVVGILALPAAAVVGAWLGMIPISAKAVPGKWETAFARLALDEAAARHAPYLTNPIAPTKENLRAGVKLFKGDCAGCHGDPNSPVTNGDASGLYPNPQVFAHKPPTKPDYQWFWIIRGGVRY